MTDRLRSKEEIRAAANEHIDRLWYYRTLAGRDRTAADLAVAEDKLRECEAKYPDLVTSGDFAVGELHGRLSALRWALGQDWGSLDT